MTWTALLPLVIQYGPSIIPLITKIIGNINAGRANDTVTPEEWAELNRLSTQTGEDIYAKLGIPPPPPAP